MNPDKMRMKMAFHIVLLKGEVCPQVAQVLLPPKNLLETEQKGLQC